MGISKMIYYVYIFFLPGSAGNFLSRCISLASDRCVGQITPTSSTPYISLESKFQAFTYIDSKKYESWTKFEAKLIPYSERFVHHDLNPNSVSIWQQHPNYNFFDKTIDGVDDKKFLFYIDPSDAFEWALLNALNKDSYIDRKWISQGKKMLDDPNIIKLKLVDIYASKETLLKCVQQICDLVGIDIKSANRTKIISLWDQWIETTVMPKDFEKFKKDIGYFDT